MLEFCIKEHQDGTWEIIPPSTGEFLFNASGDSMEAAIGKFIISNRETLNIQFTLECKDGQIKKSRNYKK